MRTCTRACVHKCAQVHSAWLCACAHGSVRVCVLYETHTGYFMKPFHKVPRVCFMKYPVCVSQSTPYAFHKVPRMGFMKYPVCVSQSTPYGFHKVPRMGFANDTISVSGGELAVSRDPPSPPRGCSAILCNPVWRSVSPHRRVEAVRRWWGRARTLVPGLSNLCVPPH